MEQKKNPLDTFSQEAPEVSAAFNNLINSITRMPGLNDKTRQLIYIGIKAAAGDADAIRYHVPMARRAGASREEVRDA
ncbi:MAG TPA: carboxymuconolactone decarboxylase family protein, partial [Cyclobacteriaceae bacterium]|nr:carboxymuconolactone decarboxylase family protein [Cyclobacteriaceae bacterium]